VVIFNLIVFILVINFIFHKVLNHLNLRHYTPELPREAEGIYDPDKYRRSREYYLTNHRFSLFVSSISFLLMLGMLYFEGFAFVDRIARSVTEHPVLLALLFFAILSIASDILFLPFSLYSIFVIEEKFGFNKMTIGTFFLDKIKGYILGAIIGGSLLALITWIYYSTGSYFWLLAWAAISLFSIFATMFYASLILPLFNKLTPLPEGELRSAIEEYCRRVEFKLDNLFVMDGSKRSSKANAFFSGLGSRKKIVLFDTLIEKHTVEELVAVLAHEIGHYKKKHTLSGVVLGVLQTGVLLFIMSLFLDNPDLARALGSDKSSFHLNIFAFGILYSPMSEILGIIMNMRSRHNEFEADAYAAETYAAIPLQHALAKLSSDNLSNPTPHPAYVFVHYSHPPLLKRLAALGKHNG
jgi:STE24 endopeptidase